MVSNYELELKQTSVRENRDKETKQNMTTELLNQTRYHKETKHDCDITPLPRKASPHAAQVQQKRVLEVDLEIDLTVGAGRRVEMMEGGGDRGSS